MKYSDLYLYPHDGAAQEAIVSGVRGCRGAKPMDSLFERLAPLWKRAMDITIALACILTIFPFAYLGMALLLALVSRKGGSVFFRQKRVGRGGRVFTCLKFRTMNPGKNASIHDAHIGFLMDFDIPMKKLDNHPNLIRFGKFLRRTCLDELPQMLNVLWGEMSLVGPRPCLPSEVERFSRWHHERFDVLPGMTGLWQVSGKNKLTFNQMIRLDIAYARDVSLRRDIRILLKTPFVILQQVWDGTSKNTVPRHYPSSPPALPLKTNTAPVAEDCIDPVSGPTPCS